MYSSNSGKRCVRPPLRPFHVHSDDRMYGRGGRWIVTNRTMEDGATWVMRAPNDWIRVPAGDATGFLTGGVKLPSPYSPCVKTVNNGHEICKCDPPVRKYGGVSYKVLSTKKAVPVPCDRPDLMNPAGCDFKCWDPACATKPIGYLQVE